MGNIPGVRACITSFRTTKNIHWVVSEMNRLAAIPDEKQYAETGQGKVNAVKRETIAIHSGYDIDPTTKAVAVPIYQTVAYAFDSTEHAAALFNLQVDGY